MPKPFRPLLVNTSPRVAGRSDTATSARPRVWPWPSDDAFGRRPANSSGCSRHAPHYHPLSVREDRLAQGWHLSCGLASLRGHSVGMMATLGRMAQRVVVHLIDDIDGETEATETVVFGLDGQTYAIDLNVEHAEGLREVLAPFISVARRAGRLAQAQNRPRRAPGGSGVDQAAVRGWARENGHQVSDRGRVRGVVLEAYRAAH